jgi:2-keto-4-pentenoate hydratase/2-oxohepta-3-ene-1,7-dioic acid hydratase in catechol pathway
MQSGSARKMIFPIPQIISFLSQGTTLPAGTVIITGTPPGIGDGRTPKVWLRDGDEVRCWISHGVGTLVNRIVYE